MLPKTNDPYIV